MKKRGIRILDPRLAGVETPKVDEACWRGREMCGFMLYEQIPNPSIPDWARDNKPKRLAWNNESRMVSLAPSSLIRRWDGYVIRIG